MAHLLGAHPGFCSMKWLGVFLLPSGLDASPSQVPPSMKFAGTHLYTWVERGTVRVKCSAQEHSTMPLARAQTRTARSGMWPPASHRCYNNCIKQMPKHWWASGGHFCDVNDGCVTQERLLFSRILISTSRFTFLGSVKKKKTADSSFRTTSIFGKFKVAVNPPWSVIFYRFGSAHFTFTFTFYLFCT